jgi:hypothetical protein
MRVKKLRFPSTEAFKLSGRNGRDGGDSTHGLSLGIWLKRAEAGHYRCRNPPPLSALFAVSWPG